MALSPGTRLGRYEIRSQLGAGGMGEVYLAWDTTLDRKVALKILPKKLAANERRMLRFVQEAKAVSALNHPNILTIHEIGTEPGAHFIATEFIDGETLRHRMVRAPLMIAEAIDTALQVASALSSAHAAGIIHRDIKPENIMLRRDGIVKVLDFGLAKLTERWRADEVDHEAATKAMVQTESGVVMGTTAYMSPEQARALEIDTRTDIWSLGVVLYEMITGRAPFKSETASDTNAAILKTELPALSQYAPDTPAELERIVRKALQKDREERYQVVKDLLLDLKSLRRDLDISAAIERSGSLHGQEQGSTAPAQKTTDSAIHVSTQASALTQQLGLNTRARWLWLAVMLLISFLVVGGWYLWRQRSETDVNRFANLTVTQLVSRKNDLGETAASHARFSPDGKFIAYASTKDGNSGIWLKQVGSGEPFTNKGEQGAATSPIWSPDGLQIAFLSKREAQSGIWTMAAFGGSPTLLKPLETYTRELVAWSREGNIYFVMQGNLYALNVARQAISPTTKLDSSKPQDRDFAISPNEERVAYADSSDGQSDIWIIPTRGGPPVRVTNDKAQDSNPVWTPDGQGILYSSKRNGIRQICMVRFDGRQPVQLTVNDSNSNVLDISTGGITFGGFTLLPYNRVQTQDFQWSPDSGRLLYCANTSGLANVWQIGIDGSGPTQLSDNTDANMRFFNPTWSSDSQRVAWLALSTGPKKVSWSIWLLAEGQKKQIFQSDSVLGLVGWSQSGQDLIVKSIPGKGGAPNAPVDVSLSAISVRDGKQRSLAQLQSTYFQNIKLAPAGNRMALVTRQDGADSLQVIPATGGAAKTIISSNDSRVYFSSIVWSNDGITIYYGKQASWSVLSIIDNFK